MARGTQRPDIRQEIKQALARQERFGMSKRENGAAGGIYSHETAKAYNRWAQDFASYVIRHSPEGRYTPLSACLTHAREYLAENIREGTYSASTVKLQRSALAKTLGVSGGDLGDVPARRREDITRSRRRRVESETTGLPILNPSSRAGHFSERNNADLVTVARGVGTRRHELANLRGTDIKTREDGTAYAVICGKGGKVRSAEVIGDRDRILELAKEAGPERIFSHVPQAMDVHYYRARYAQDYYEQLARPVDTLDRSERYDCRGDKAGVSYDREAMLVVSQSLGHERVSVIATNYLW